MTQVSNSKTLLGDWYVNLLVIDRRKCLLFMSERTLLSFISFGYRKSNRLKVQIHEAFIFQFFNLCKLLGLPFDGLNSVMDDYITYEFAKTDSRKLLGNMNDLAYLYQVTITETGGFSHCDLNDIILQMNNMPQANLNHQSPVDIAVALMQNSSGFN